ncbi:MAG: hypothetical protein HY831_03575 [Candidatus Aenigmarchaeota archaeon]|nr:hypothetical protein [Candidatus Aenigmarchaeota archaeon]
MTSYSIEVPRWLSAFIILFISVFCGFWVYVTVKSGNYLFTLIGVIMAAVMLAILGYTFVNRRYPYFIRNVKK